MAGRNGPLGSLPGDKEFGYQASYWSDIGGNFEWVKKDGLNVLLYNFIKFVLRAGLLYYYRDIRISGMRHVPWQEPLIMLPNHQNGLIDPLIVAAFVPCKPHILTRSDVFANSFLGTMFGWLRMLPVYRMRDGWQNVSKNRDIFRVCSSLLAESETLLVFPEANHCLERRVRPLSKGFTRILFRALTEHQGMEVYLLPIGVNYKHAAGFPDSAAFYFGTAEPYRKRWYRDSEHKPSMELRAKVAGDLQKLTTHIPSSMDYSEGLGRLERAGTDYLEPSVTNGILAGSGYKTEVHENKARRSTLKMSIWDVSFVIFNLPFFLIWRGIIKPRVKEVEFLTTYRFLYGMSFYPLGYLLGFFLLYTYAGWPYAPLCTLAHLIYNRCYIKYR